MGDFIIFNNIFGFNWVILRKIHHDFWAKINENLIYEKKIIVQRSFTETPN